jgi:glycerophosphoryl diester phosphodiesterase
MHVLAHRGDARRRPENTVHALLAALAIPGCDGLEFDVRAAGDGTPVIAHDETLARVFGRPERVADLSVAELGEAGLPTLHEVLVTIPTRAFLDVELKEDVGPAVVPVLRGARGEGLANAVVSSFDHATIEVVRRLAPGWPVWLNVLALDETAIADALRLGARGVSADEATIDAAGVDAARAAGLDVAAWTIRHVQRLAELAALGVAAVCVEDDALDSAAAIVAAIAGGRPAPAGGEGGGPGATTIEKEPPG